MLLFEEFGREPLDANAPAPADSFPAPTVGPAPEQDPGSVAASAPAGVTLEAFLAQAGIAPFPTQFSNTMDQNPWKLEIEAFLGRQLKTSSRRRPAAGTRLGPPELERVLPPGVLQDRPGRRPRERRLPRHAYSCTATRSGNSAPAGSTTTPRALPATEGTTKGIAIQLPPEHADPEPEGPLDLRRHASAQAAHGALRRSRS